VGGIFRTFQVGVLVVLEIHQEGNVSKVLKIGDLVMKTLMVLEIYRGLAES
jgi:hypothetical protein